MTMHARLVLEDAREAIKELPSGESGPYDEPTIWRRLVAAMALIRAVYDILWNLDAKTSDTLHRAIQQKNKEPKDPIYYDFINDYRNAVIHHYKKPEVDFDVDMGTRYPRLSVEYGGWVYPLNYQFEEAIRFWEQYLNDIDKLTKQYEQES